MVVKSKLKKRVINKKKVSLTSPSVVQHIDTKKQGFLQKNFFPYSFPLVVVGLVFLILFIFNISLFNLSSFFQESADLNLIRILYVLLLVGFFLWSLLICAVFGTLTNFIILNGLMPFLNCSMEKFELNKFLKMPLIVFSLLMLSLVLSVVINFFNQFFGLTALNVSSIVIFALFLLSIIIVKKSIAPACKSSFLGYLVSFVFVLINYIQFLVIFTTILVVLILTVYFTFAGFA